MRTLVLTALVTALCMCSLASVASGVLPSNVVPVSGYDNITAPPDQGPQCLPTAASADELASIRVGVVLADSASAYDYAVAFQFFEQRGASVSLLCLDTNPVLIDMYYPRFTAACTAMSSTGFTVGDYDVIFVPSGFSAVENLRLATGVTSSIQSFTQIANGGGTPQVLILSGGASELTIESGLLPALAANQSIPPVSESISVWIAKQGANTTLQIDPTFNLSVASVNYGAPANNKIAFAKNSTYLIELLLNVSRTVFNTAPPTNMCGAPLVVQPSGTQPVTIANYNSLLSNTNKARQRVDEHMLLVCTNNDRLNFCDGWEFAIMVSHGSHDDSVISTIQSLNQNNAVVHVWCADEVVDVNNGVYLMPFPSRAPTYWVQCDRLLSYWSYIAPSLQGTIVVPTGLIATHGALRSSNDLFKAMAKTGTYSLYGSALILLTEQDIQENVGEVPQCRYVERDLRDRGFTIGANSSTVQYRDKELKRAKVLSGYQGDAITMELGAFFNQTVNALVWENGDSSQRDAVVAGLFLAIAGATLLAVIVVGCYRSKVLARRSQERVPIAKSEVEADNADIFATQAQSRNEFS